MIKKKICSLLAAMMISTLVLGNGGQVVHASTLGENTAIVLSETVIKNGTYEVNNTVEYDGDNTTGSNMARNAVDEKTTIKVEDGKVTMTLIFNSDLYMFMKDIKVSLDGVNLNGVNNAEDKSITFEVPSVDSKVKVDMTVIAMGMDVAFYVTNDTSNLPVVEEEENTENGAVLENGTYVIGNKTLKNGADSESSIRKYIEEKTYVTVKDGNITVTMKYNEQGLETVIGTHSITINGTSVPMSVNADGSISFNVNSIEDLYNRIVVELTYTDPALPEFIFPDKKHTVSIDLIHEGELEKATDSDLGNNNGGDNGSSDNNGGDSNGGNVDNGGNSGGSGDSNNNGSNEEVQANKVYTIKNEVTHETAIGQNMARQYLSDTAKIEEINGKYYVTLMFTGADLMTNHEVSVNGIKVDVTKKVNGDATSVRFAVNGINDTLSVSTFVVPMGRNVDFGVTLLEDTLTLVEDNSIADDLVSGGVTDNGTTGGSTSGSTSDSSSDTTTEENKTVTGKLYSIQNNVKHESETGRDMARKYLKSTSKVEEIEGKYYVTLTFTGSAFMQNHEIYVNGSKVSVSRSTSGDETNIRFAVSSLSDKIVVKTYVVPMDRNVEFEVELLVDTLTFIKDFTVSTLPNTGGTSAAAVLGLGAMLTTAGTVLTRKRK